MGIYIGGQNIKPNAVTTEKIVDGTITESDLDAALQAKVNAAAAPLDGTGTSGTWPINVTGNAATATTAEGLQTTGSTFSWDTDHWTTPDYIAADVTGDLTGNATTATTATNLGSTALGIVKTGASGAPSSATGADVAALLAGTNLVTSGTVTARQVASTAQTTAGASNVFTPDASLGSIITVTLGAAGCTLANPTNLLASTRYIVLIKQDATGSRTITTWGNLFRFPGGAKPTLTSTANAIDIAEFVYVDSVLYMVNFVAGEAA